MPVELDKRIEDLTIDEALLLECLERLAEVEDDTSITPLPFCISTDITYETAAEEIVGEPKDWA